MTRHYLIRTAALLGVTLGGLSVAQAQGLPGFLNTWTGTTGNWSDNANWSGATIPDGQDVLGAGGDDFGVIDNGGVALVTTSVTSPNATPGGVGIGSDDGLSGTLRILNGGALEVMGHPDFDADGSVNVGRNASGLGVLEIEGSGMLMAESLNLGGAAGSTISLRDTASVSLDGNAILGRTTSITGPGVSFSTTGDLQLLAASQLSSGITGSTHSTLNAAGTATIDGDLIVSFNGVTPTASSSWRLVDAGSIVGPGFGTITSNTPLGPGQSLSTRVTTANTTHDEALELFVQQSLVLTVNRNTGEVVIENFGDPVDFDAYSLRSQSGALAPGSWQQIGAPWESANSSATQLNELRQTGHSTLAASSVTSLGQVFSPVVPTEFGVAVEDIEFEYSGPSDSGVVGAVRYVGDASLNNLVLIVDPSDGRSLIKNASTFEVDIDGYTISSFSESLQPANNDWLSLEDSGEFAGWEEATADAGRLSELQQVGATQLTSGRTFDVGMLFDASSGTQDLVFQFLLAGESTPRTGIVLYQAILDGLAGDYNEDGVVDAIDYAVWRENLGTPFALPNRKPGETGNVGSADYQFWRDNFGAVAASGGIEATSPAPEPRAWLLLACLLAVYGSYERWRSLSMVLVASQR